MSKPIKSIRLSGVECAIWEKDGRQSCTFQKRYKDKDGNFKSTQYFNVEDCAAIAFVASRAISHIQDLKDGVVKPSTNESQAVTTDDDCPF